MNALQLQSPAINQTMTSREIAELTGKEHKNLLADIRTMLEGLGATSAEFSANLPDAYGRPQPGFRLPKRETLILVSGYSVAMRARIIDRWQELEAQQQAAFIAPTNLREALLLALAQEEQIEALSTAKAALEHKAAVDAPKVVLVNSWTW
jgi:anti-repressor protein